MTERDTAWPVGTPCWADLMTPDLDAARLFYEQLFGWHLTDLGPDAGGYLMAGVGGKQVAGLGPQQEGQAGHPAVWTTYLATEDAAATCEAISKAGGQVFLPAMDVMGSGVMAVAADPTGAVFGLWEAKTHTGFQLANESGSVTWNEQLSRDFEGAKQFYADVFGYTFEDMSSGGMQYAIVQVDGNGVGGMGSMPAEVPEEVPAHWRTYFAVDDADESVNEVVRLGGTVRRPAEDMPYGRWADVADPTGASFSVIKPGPDPDAGDTSTG
jgi:predicted enzyme related to lactoylglutathione lyase